MKINGATALIRCLEELEVTHIFGYPGGANLPIYDALYYSKKITHILAMNEQGAALMADGYARIKKKIGVCLVTSGPGVTNMVTGLATSYLDSVPIIALTGQIPTGFIGTDAFQEVDTFSITLSITKHNELITNPDNIVPSVKMAFEIANSGRKGPVLLDFPKDIALAKIDYSASNSKTIPIPGYKPNIKANIGQIKRCLKKLAGAKTPLIIVGGGVERSGSKQLLQKFVEFSKIPCVRTLMGKNSFDNNHPLYAGMIGTHGTVAGNKAIPKADLILAIGTRFGDRTTLMKKEKFAKNAEIIHVDIDPSEISKIVVTSLPIVSDIKEFLKDLLVEYKKKPWVKELWIESKTQKNILSKEDNAEIVGLILEKLSQINKNLHISTDVGRHQLWAIHCCNNTKHQPLLTSGGLGTMGYGLPAAIGAWFAEPSVQVVNITGDGSFFMNMQEFIVAVKYNIPLVIILINDNRLSMIRELQSTTYQKRYIAQDLDNNLDFVKLAESMGGVGYNVFTKKEILSSIEKAIKDKRPTIINFEIKRIANS